MAYTVHNPASFRVDLPTQACQTWLLNWRLLRVNRWYLPETYYTVDLPTPAGGPTIRAIFVDANPFIEAYNTSSKAQYNTQYFQSHVSLP